MSRKKGSNHSQVKCILELGRALELDKEIIEFNRNLDFSKNYRFFLELGLKVHKHKTQFEKTPGLIQRIVNEQLELLYKAKFAPDLEEYFKGQDDHLLDSIKMMIDYEKDRRRKIEEDERRKNCW